MNLTVLNEILRVRSVASFWCHWRNLQLGTVLTEAVGRMARNLSVLKLPCSVGQVGPLDRPAPPGLHVRQFSATIVVHDRQRQNQAEPRLAVQGLLVNQTNLLLLGWKTNHLRFSFASAATSDCRRLR